MPGSVWKGTNRPGVNTRRLMPKRKHSRMPTNTGGMDIQIWSTTMRSLSMTLPSRRATQMPRGKETATVSRKAITTRAPVAGSFSMTMALTGEW